MKVLALLSVVTALSTSVVAKTNQNKAQPVGNSTDVCDIKDCAVACHHARSPKNIYTLTKGGVQAAWFLEPFLRCVSTNLNPACTDEGCNCMARGLADIEATTDCLLYRMPTEDPKGETEPHSYKTWGSQGATRGQCCQGGKDDLGPIYSCNIQCNGGPCPWFQSENVEGMDRSCPASAPGPSGQ